MLSTRPSTIRVYWYFTSTTPCEPCFLATPSPLASLTIAYSQQSLHSKPSMRSTAIACGCSRMLLASKLVLTEARVWLPLSELMPSIRLPSVPADVACRSSVPSPRHWYGSRALKSSDSTTSILSSATACRRLRMLLAIQPCPPGTGMAPTLQSAELTPSTSCLRTSADVAYLSSVFSLVHWYGSRSGTDAINMVTIDSLCTLADVAYLKRALPEALVWLPPPAVLSIYAIIISDCLRRFADVAYLSSMFS
ncbi:hypothetical protein EWM64_g7041 [Hericium alpestre]|uniref:Uncharacterized protein n=1 Tax=Hericium alpestre TaxID=135208 RepID=A0A4Y9ZT27_9AGAM|nr:hypothetical protein EWM64_g7041 [Hericium alpestre]